MGRKFLGVDACTVMILSQFMVPVTCGHPDRDTAGAMHFSRNPPDRVSYKRPAAAQIPQPEPSQGLSFPKASSAPRRTRSRRPAQRQGPSAHA